VLALSGVGIGDAEADEASAGVELLEPGSDGEAEVGVGGVEVSEVGSVVDVVEEEVADDLVGHQAAQDLHPHRRRPFPPAPEAKKRVALSISIPPGLLLPPLGMFRGSLRQQREEGEWTEGEANDSVCSPDQRNVVSLATPEISALFRLPLR